MTTDHPVTSRRLDYARTIEFRSEAKVDGPPSLPAVVARAVADWLDANPAVSPLQIMFDHYDDSDRLDGTATERLLAAIRGAVTFTATATLTYEDVSSPEGPTDD